MDIEKGQREKETRGESIKNLIGEGQKEVARMRTASINEFEGYLDSLEEILDTLAFKAKHHNESYVLMAAAVGQYINPMNDRQEVNEMMRLAAMKAALL